MATMSGPRSLAALRPIARQALGKHSAALGVLFADWPAVIGEEAELETVLAGIDDDGLRARLAELRRVFYSRGGAAR